MRVELGHSGARNWAATVGALFAALLVGWALAVWLPVSFPMRLTLGGYCVFPLWTLFAVLLFLSRSGERAWAWVLGICLVAGGLGAGGMALGVGAPPATPNPAASDAAPPNTSGPEAAKRDDVKEAAP